MTCTSHFLFWPLGVSKCLILKDQFYFLSFKIMKTHVSSLSFYIYMHIFILAFQNFHIWKPVDWNAGSESNLLSASPLWPWWSPNMMRAIVHHMISLPLASPVRLTEKSDSLVHEAPVEKKQICVVLQEHPPHRIKEWHSPCYPIP